MERQRLEVLLLELHLERGLARHHRGRLLRRLLLLLLLGRLGRRQALIAAGRSTQRAARGLLFGRSVGLVALHAGSGDSTGHGLQLGVADDGGEGPSVVVRVVVATDRLGRGTQVVHRSLALQLLLLLLLMMMLLRLLMLLGMMVR